MKKLSVAITAVFLSTMSNVTYSEDISKGDLKANQKRAVSAELKNQNSSQDSSSAGLDNSMRGKNISSQNTSYSPGSTVNSTNGSAGRSGVIGSSASGVNQGNGSRNISGNTSGVGGAGSLSGSGSSTGSVSGSSSGGAGGR